MLHDSLCHFGVLLIDFLLFSDSLFTQINFVETVIFLKFPVFFLLNLLEEMFIFELDKVLSFEELMLVRPLSRPVEKGHIEIRGSIEAMFFVHNGLDAAQVARVLIVLGKFVVET